MSDVCERLFELKLKVISKNVDVKQLELFARFKGIHVTPSTDSRF